MEGIISSTNCYVKHTGTTKGRGVYAKRNLEAGDIIEECPVLVILRMPCPCNFPPSISITFYITTDDFRLGVSRRNQQFISHCTGCWKPLQPLK